MQRGDLGHEVRRRREERGWTIAELATLADISGATLSDIESGVTTSPHRPTLRGLARALDCTIEELTGEAPKPVAAPSSGEEVQLLETYRALNQERRAAARQVMDGLLRLQQESSPSDRG